MPTSTGGDPSRKEFEIMSVIVTHSRALRAAVSFGCALMLSAAVSEAADYQMIEDLPKCCKESSYGPGEYRRDFEVGGRTRIYLIHVPPSYSPGEPMPVVLNFHGGAGNASSQIELTGMNETADKAGFIAVYPAGTGRLKMFLTFNAGSCCGYARDEDVDDVEFVDGLLEDLEKVFCIDRDRIYATGHSNGAMMSYRLACDLSDQIAAIAAVAGPIGVDSCKPDRAVPILHFHGTADECAPIKGGAGKSKSAGTFRSVDSTISKWQKIDGCDAKPKTTYDKGNVVCTTYGGCEGGAEITLCTIKGGGHAWPGGTKYPAEKICGGKLSDEISANEFMWEFFEKHSLDDDKVPTRRGADRRVKPEASDVKKPE